MEQSEQVQTKLTEPLVEGLVEMCRLGTLLLRQGQVDDAFQHFEAAVSAQPEYFDALFNGGLCHLYREEKEQALAWFTRAAALRPEDWQAQYVTGEILLQIGRADEALPYFRAARAGNPTHFETLQGLAITLMSRERYEETAILCDETMMIHGAAALPLQLKGDAMLALGRHEEAVRCHIDLCRTDLDIRDFIVSRLQALRKVDEQAFTAYRDIVRKSYPEFGNFVKLSISTERKSCSGCLNNQLQKEN